ncbi:hypothetical protein [Campylobacter concisus]
MKFLVKIFCLLSLIISLSFAENQSVNVFRDDFVKGFEKVSGVEVGF